MSVQLGWSYIKVLGYRVSDRKFLGYWRVGDSAVGSDQGAGESEGCGEGGATCPCSCWTVGSWASG